MRHFKKLYLTKIICILVAVIFTITSVGYGMDFHEKSHRTHLRNPLLFNKNVSDETGDDRFEKAASSEKIDDGALPARRDFIKMAILAVFPLFLLRKRGGNRVIIQDKQVPLSLEHLNSLSKKEAKGYFIKLNNLIHDKNISSLEASRFLWQVFEESNIVWMRAEAIRLLIRHKVIKFEEAKRILNSSPDGKVVESIYEALAEAPTEEIIFFLRDRVRKEPSGYFTQKAFHRSLEKADIIPQEISNEILRASEEGNFFAYRYMDWYFLKQSFLVGYQDNDPCLNPMQSTTAG